MSGTVKGTRIVTAKGVSINRHYFEAPFKIGQLAIGAQGKFFDRTLDTNIKHTTQTMIESANFKGRFFGLFIQL